MKYLKQKLDRAGQLAQVIGFEGSAAKAYFKGLSKLINVANFKFNGRSRRPPRDKFNSILSFGYTVLMNQIYSSLEGRGLSPFFGFIHQDREGHPSLVSDLIEEWRAVIVDSIAMALVNGREVTEEDFYRDEETTGICFTSNGLKIFIAKLENRLNTSIQYLEYLDHSVTFRRAIDYQALQLCKAIEENNPHHYQPVEIR